MKISRDWLQTFFDSPLPESAELSEALTFHAFEIESIENDVLDVKVTANRGHDCLSHRGIAKELSAILEKPLRSDPLRQQPDLSQRTDTVEVRIEEPSLCKRYIAGYIRGVQVGSSPEWLQKALESVGQRSINNVVDATNYVMFNLGQPLHAFDAGRLIEKDGVYSIKVRKAKSEERMVALDEKEYTLSDSMLVIADARADSAIGIAGVKGGAPASITQETSDIIIESANFEGVSVRKTAAALKLRTDASSRFEQAISQEIAAYGMRAVADLILELAGGELVGFVDEYPVTQEKMTASVSVSHINKVLGTSFSAPEIVRIFERLDLAHAQTGDTFEVHAPFERLDLSIPEDVVEEVARIAGYEHVPTVELPPLSTPVEVNAGFARSERIRAFLCSLGFSEVFTSVFTTKGDRVVLNKVDGVKPHLRRSIAESLQEALERNIRNKDLLGLAQVKIFEIGTVWKGGIEETEVEIAVENVKGQKKTEEYKKLVEEHLVEYGAGESYEDLPFTGALRYEPFSKYPFIVRDIALWVPDGTQADEVLDVIRDASGALLARSALFDEFTKEGRTSYAFRLVFQSFDKTLTDQEANERMESVNTAVTVKGWQVR
ncbi:MAG: phenylalanine--tRNA ligase subunit beta [Minisyncoccota bacterium]